jgi:hypothetical protein
VIVEEVKDGVVVEIWERSCCIFVDSCAMVHVYTC